MKTLLFYVERDNIEFCIYQSITNIVFCHDKSIRFVRIQFGVYISTPGRIKYFYGNNIFYRRSLDKIICCNFACFTCCYFSNVNSNTVTILSFSIRAMCLNLYLKICTKYKDGFRGKQFVQLFFPYSQAQELIKNSLCSCHLVGQQMPKLQRLLNNTLQWFLIHYNQTPVQVKWRFWLICSEGYYFNK